MLSVDVLYSVNKTHIKVYKTHKSSPESMSYSSVHIVIFMSSKILIYYLSGARLEEIYIIV